MANESSIPAGGEALERLAEEWEKRANAKFWDDGLQHMTYARNGTLLECAAALRSLLMEREERNGDHEVQEALARAENELVWLWGSSHARNRIRPIIDKIRAALGAVEPHNAELPDQDRLPTTVGERTVGSSDCRESEAPSPSGDAAPEPVQDGWRSTESAPRDGTKIWAFWQGLGNDPRIIWFGRSEWRDGPSTMDEYREPSHWRPLEKLPAPPAAKEGE